MVEKQPISGHHYLQVKKDDLDDVLYGTQYPVCYNITIVLTSSTNLVRDEWKFVGFRDTDRVMYPRI